MRLEFNARPSPLQTLKLARHSAVAGASLLSMLSFAALAQSGQRPLKANVENPALASADQPAPRTNLQSTPPLEPGKATDENPSEIQRRQIADQSATLLRLAAELKAAIDNSDQSTLSIHIVRKADSIAELAHRVKEEMKQTAPQH